MTASDALRPEGQRALVFPVELGSVTTPRQLQGAAVRRRISALPTNATGKILKNELRARAATDLGET